MFSLLSHLSYALVEDEAIFLDTRQDSYFAVGKSVCADLAMLERTGGDLEERVARRLLDANLVRPSDGPGRTAATRTPVPDADLADDGKPGRTGVLELVEIAGLIALALRRLRLGQLERIIAGLQVREPDCDPDAVHDAARRFAILRRRLPVTRRCLPDSIALA